MDHVLYVMASGAKQIMHAQTVNSNNLANANTTGFQADLANFDAQYLTGPGADSRVYSVAEDIGLSFDKGGIISTGRELDVAVNGDGWIAVQAPDGTEAYTRAGDLKVNVNGQLLTGAGHPVLGDGGPLIVPDFQKLEIAGDGSISVLPVGQTPTTMAEVGRIKLVAPDMNNLIKGQDGLLRTRDANQAEASNNVSLISGVLETSNVNSVEALVNMIDYARQFEMTVKLMKSAERMDEQTTKIMNIG
ncbi:MAG: flagellar basal body rod protein FlgF [Gammaproteobacteria bacterium]